MVAVPLRSVVRWVKRIAAVLVCIVGLAGVLTPELLTLGPFAPHRHLAEATQDVDVCDEAQSADSAAGEPAQSLNSARDTDKPEDVERQPVERIMTFLAGCFLIGCLLDHFTLYLPKMVRLPYSLALYLSGLLVGLIAFEVNPNRTDFKILFWGTRDASQVDAHAIFYIFLPPLLYESASSMSWHVFHKIMSSASLLALPGVLLNIILTGCVMMLIESRFKWEDALMLSSILSATDPVAVVAALQELGAPQKLSTLIEGESLLNDGSAVVFFYVFRDIVAENAPADSKRCRTPSATCIGLLFLRLALGGLAFGVVCGKFTSVWLGFARSHHQPTLEVGILFVAVYVTFAVAEAIEVSGVLAVVTLGIYVSARAWTQLSHHGRHVHHVVFKTIGYLCNQGLFFISGIVSYRFMFRDSCSNWWWQLAVLYIVVHITRGLVVVFFWPFLRRWGYGISLKEGMVVVFGGLRGAVGLAMGLLVEHDEYVDLYLKKAIAFNTSGIVLLTLLINGSTVSSFYDRLKLYPPNPFRMNHVRKMLTHLEDDCRQIYKAASKDWFFEGVQWDEVLRCVPDFRNIDFGLAGAPEFGKGSTVRTTLASLQASANNFCTTKLREAHSFDEKYESRWERRKKEERPRPSQRASHNLTPRNGLLLPEKVERVASGMSTKSGMGQVTSMQSGPGLRKWLPLTRTATANTMAGGPGSEHMYARDQLVRMSNKGDRRLVYGTETDPDHDHGEPAVYVSSRSLAAFPSQEFVVQLAETEQTKTSQIIVGAFLERNKQARQLEPSWQELVSLGFTKNSVGYDCYHGRVQWNAGDGEAGIGEDHDLTVIKEGMSICVRATQDDDEVWALSFIMTQSNKELTVVPLPGISAEEIFPVIEFRNPAWDARQREKLRHSAHRLKLGEEETHGGRRRRRSVMQTVTSALSLRGSLPSPRHLRSSDDTDGEGSPHSLHTSETGEANSFTRRRAPSPATSTGKSPVRSASKSPIRSGDSQLPGSPPSGECSPPPERHSFKESMAHIVDSTLHHAIHLVEDEVRLVNDKVKHLPPAKVLLSFEPRTATDAEGLNMMFQFIFNALSRQYHMMHEHRNLSAGSFTRLTDSVAHAGDCANNENGAANVSVLLETETSSSLATGQSIRDLDTDQLQQILQGRLQRLPALAEAAGWQEYEALFVEYLIIEKYCSTPSFWDNCRWKSLQWIGYGRTKCKIEMLWAFIETHERILGELSKSAVTRFPQLRRLMKSLIDQAKADLRILEDINPRHYLFAKHYIALRMVFTMKLGKLEKCVNQGWVSASDAENLQEELEERLHQVENYFPHIDTVPLMDGASEFVPKSSVPNLTQSANVGEEGSWDFGGANSGASGGWHHQLRSTLGLGNLSDRSKEWGRNWREIVKVKRRSSNMSALQSHQSANFRLDQEAKGSHDTQGTTSTSLGRKAPQIHVADIEAPGVQPLTLPDSPSPLLPTQESPNFGGGTAVSCLSHEVGRGGARKSRGKRHITLEDGHEEVGARPTTPAWPSGDASANSFTLMAQGTMPAYPLTLEPLQPFGEQPPPLPPDARQPEAVERGRSRSPKKASRRWQDNDVNANGEATLPGVVTLSLSSSLTRSAPPSPGKVQVVLSPKKDVLIASMPSQKHTAPETSDIPLPGEDVATGGQQDPWSVPRPPASRQGSLPLLSASQETTAMTPEGS